jgi:hypothetical protein
VDTADSAIGSVFGQGTSAGNFNYASLGSSVFGVQSNSLGYSYAAAGMFTTVPATPSLQGVGDVDEGPGDFVASASTISGTYSIESSGYGDLTITNGGLGDVSYFGIYMTDPSLNLTDPNNPTGGGGALIVDLDFVVGTGVLIPQTDTAPADFTGNYAFGAQEYNFNNFWEFDFVGQGSVTGGVLAGTGLVSDPGLAFGETNPPNSGVPFGGTATPDAVNVGRFTIPLAITLGTNPTLNVVIYQASGPTTGGQLFWLEEDPASVFLGPLELQGSLSGLPAAKKPVAKTNKNRTK